jgi:hypothetical protein
MVEEILKRKRETTEKLKQRRSIKEAILKTKKAEKTPIISEVKRRGLKEGEDNLRSKKKRLKRRRRSGRNRSCGSGEPNGKRRCMCNIRSNRRGFFR